MEDTGANAIDPVGGWLEATIGNLLGLVSAGGPIVAALLVLSVFVLTIIVLKLWQYARLGLGANRRAERASALWIAGDKAAALALVEGRRNPVLKVLAHAMRGLTAAPEDEGRVREDVERIALGELASLRAYLRGIEATVQVAPLLGLFGTVLGMIDAFRSLQSAGAEADPAILAGGIWVALLTTAVGLSIAIPAALVLYWFEGLVERQRLAMETKLTGIFTGRISERTIEPQPAARRPTLTAVGNAD
ncbi:MAG TPA: MotA/TolQ/ExbB proton channel family protein [Hyphomicrobiales bacterium]|nr:MotA/TolQ/ExbB proton channel family protein [Kaistiaceae bacterium]HQF31993.1 MotA/TolQ/ExbB proton channel family protein [Hyphomicrobiales bacterium]